MPVLSSIMIKSILMRTTMMGVGVMPVVYILIIVEPPSFPLVYLPLKHWLTMHMPCFLLIDWLIKLMEWSFRDVYRLHYRAWQCQNSALWALSSLVVTYNVGRAGMSAWEMVYLVLSFIWQHLCCWVLCHPSWTALCFWKIGKLQTLTYTVVRKSGVGVLMYRNNVKG